MGNKCISKCKRDRCAASRDETNRDPERQIRTRSTKQQNVIDIQPIISQCRVNNDVGIPVTRQRREVSNISAKPQQNTRQEQEGISHKLRNQQQNQQEWKKQTQTEQQSHELQEQQQCQRLKMLTQPKLKEEELQDQQKLEKEQREKQQQECQQLKQKNQMLQQQHHEFQRQLELHKQQQHQRQTLKQPKVPLVEDQQQPNNALFDSYIMSDVHQQQESEMSHVMKNNQQDHVSLHGQELHKNYSESYEQELDKRDGFVQRETGSKIGKTSGAQTKTYTDTLIDQNKTVANEDGVIVQQSVVKDNQQHQSKTGKWNMDSELFVGTSDFDKRCYIARQNQQPMEPHFQEQQYELQKPQRLQQAPHKPRQQTLQKFQPGNRKLLKLYQLQKRGWRQPKRKKPQSNEENRKELQRQQKQRRQYHQQQQRQLDLSSDESDQDNNFDNKFVRTIPESELTEQQILVLRKSGDNFDYDEKTQGRDEQQNGIETQTSKTLGSNGAYTEVRSNKNDPPEPKQCHANLTNGQLLYEFEQKGLDKLEQLNNKLQQQLFLTDQKQYLNAAELLKQDVHERGEYDETEIGTEIGETYEAPTQSDKDLLVHKNQPAVKENRLTGLSHVAYKQYLTEIIKLYEYSRTFIPLIENFVGVAGSDGHYYIEESLTRTLLELDRLPAENCPELRYNRRTVIKYIYDLLDRLDYRVNQIQ